MNTDEHRLDDWVSTPKDHEIGFVETKVSVFIGVHLWF